LNGIYKRDVEVGLKKGRECVEKSIRVSKSIEVSKAWVRRDGGEVNLKQNIKICRRIVGIRGGGKGSLSHKRCVSGVVGLGLVGGMEPRGEANLGEARRDNVICLKDVGMKPKERSMQSLRRGQSTFGRREIENENVKLASKIQNYKSPLARDRILKASDKFLNAKKFLTNFKLEPRLKILPPVELRDNIQLYLSPEKGLKVASQYSEIFDGSEGPDARDLEKNDSPERNKLDFHET
jgi:hypothetical protein